MKYIFYILLFIAFEVNAYSYKIDSSLSLDLSIRYRFEYWDGMNVKNYGDDSPTAIGKLNDKILLQRIIAGFNYNLDDKIKFAFHLYDARAFGWSLSNSISRDFFKIKNPNNPDDYYIMNPNEQFFEIYDLFISFNNIIPNLSTIIGRQKIFFSDFRVMGPGDWRNTGRWTWDALRIIYNKTNFIANLWLGGTKTQDPEQTTIPFTNTEFWGGGIYSQIKLLPTITLEPFFIFKTQGSASYIKDNNIHRYWVGARLVDSNLFNFDYDFHFTKEFGEEAGKNINAFGLFARLGYRFNFLTSKPLLSLRYTYASGNTDKNEIRKFDPAYGAQDKYYGWMNIVSWTNLDDREIVLELFPIPNLWFEVKYNDFYIPEPDNYTIMGTIKLKEGSKHLGSELNLFSKYSFKSWQFSLVLGYFFAGDIMPINNHPVNNAFHIGTQVLFNL